ncbi:sensor histidine kinase [Streptomyces sp. NPDC088812]|uniref:ATP-binding protein n=1 Tax=Streptomyces sp. NPDC088812 TaxID=3365905 RepID=UPI003820FFA1
MTPLLQEALILAPCALAAAGGGSAVYFARSAARHRQAAGAATRRATDAAQRAAAQEEEAQHLAGSRLPGLIYAMQHGAGDPTAVGALLHQVLAGTDTDRAHQTVLEQVFTALSEAATRSEGAARVAVQATTRSVQPLGYELQSAITKLLSAGHDHKTLELVQPIDHTASQLLRRLQILGVLTGMWPGRQRDDVPLLDAVRGGISRIRDFPRVQVPPARPLYVAGRYVEPLVLLLAELLDNAARHSAPTTPVEVSFVETHNGVSVEIHDAGPGMTPEALHEARRRVSGQYPVQFTELSNPAAFGLHGVGVLAGRYGFRASLDIEHSRYGGTRAVVQVPRTMLAPPPAQEPQHTAHRPAATEPASAAPAAPRHSPYPVADDGLPVRRRRGAVAPPVQAAPDSEPPPPRAGQGLAAFASGTRSAHHPTPQEPTS